MKQYQTLLFDLDGTLSDSGLGIINGIKKVMEHYQVTLDNQTQLSEFIGPPLFESFQKYFGFTSELALEAILVYREYYATIGLYENTLYSGMEECLHTLKKANKRLIVATSKPEIFAIDILKHFKIDHYFDAIVGSTTDGSREKKADVIAYAIKENHIDDLQSTLMIGDRKHDILGAQANHIDSMGVLYGYGSLVELQQANATYIVKDLDELLKIVL